VLGRGEFKIQERKGGRVKRVAVNKPRRFLLVFSNRMGKNFHFIGCLTQIRNFGAKAVQNNDFDKILLLCHFAQIHERNEQV
jgi:hypothetical protein